MLKLRFRSREEWCKIYKIIILFFCFFWVFLLFVCLVKKVPRAAVVLREKKNWRRMWCLMLVLLVAMIINVLMDVLIMIWMRLRLRCSPLMSSDFCLILIDTLLVDTSWNHHLSFLPSSSFLILNWICAMPLALLLKEKYFGKAYFVCCCYY